MALTVGKIRLTGRYMNRSKRLLSNTLIFTVGNLGSKLISFLLVPMYTYFFTTEQYGTVDLLITTMNLCLPLISLSLFDAVFRFVMNKEMNATSVLSTGIFSILFVFFCLMLLTPVFNYIQLPNAFLFILCIGGTALFTMFQNFTRAYGGAKIFAVSGIVNSLALAFFNVLLIMVMKMKVEGYLLSYLFSVLIAIFYLICRAKLWHHIRLTAFSNALLKKMLQYSVPLIPNSLAWWFTNGVGRFFILYFVGVSANGLFAVANKIPTIINLFFVIFIQAWQISVVDEYKSSDRSGYYSDVFKSLQQFLFVLVALIISLIKPMMAIFFSNSYYESWKYMPILLIAVVFVDLASFLGTIYLAAEKTTGLFSTTLYGMIVNLIVSGLLTPMIGVNGTGIGMATGFLTMVLLRLHSINKFLEVEMPWRIFNISVIGITIMTVGLYSNNLMVEIMLIIVGLTVVIYVNSKFLIRLARLFTTLVSKSVIQILRKARND